MSRLKLNFMLFIRDTHKYNYTDELKVQRRKRHAKQIKASWHHYINIKQSRI